MDVVWEYFKETYYLIVVANLTALVGLILSFHRKSKITYIKYIRLYFILFILLFFLNSLSAYYYKLKSSEAMFFIVLQQQMDFAFTSFEFYLFLFILKPFVNKTLYHVSACVFFVAMIECYIEIFSSKDFFNGSAVFELFNFQAFLLLAVSLSYFLNIFRRFQIVRLVHYPSFWISTGLGIFVISTLPFSIMTNYLFSEGSQLFDRLFSIFFVFYTLFFIMIIRGFFCKTPTNDLIIEDQMDATRQTLFTSHNLNEENSMKIGSHT
jgi:hypothetical protein